MPEWFYGANGSRQPALDALGEWLEHQSQVLEGGHSRRHYVPPAFIVHGTCGIGKTRMIQYALDNAQLKTRFFRVPIADDRWDSISQDILLYVITEAGHVEKEDLKLYASEARMFMEEVENELKDMADFAKRIKRFKELLSDWVTDLRNLGVNLPFLLLIESHGYDVALSGISQEAGILQVWELRGAPPSTKSSGKGQERFAEAKVSWLDTEVGPLTMKEVELFICGLPPDTHESSDCPRSCKLIPPDKISVATTQDLCWKKVFSDLGGHPRLLKLARAALEQQGKVAERKKVPIQEFVNNAYLEIGEELQKEIQSLVSFVRHSGPACFYQILENWAQNPAQTPELGLEHLKKKAVAHGNEPTYAGGKWFIPEKISENVVESVHKKPSSPKHPGGDSMDTKTKASVTMNFLANLRKQLILKDEFSRNYPTVTDEFVETINELCATLATGMKKLDRAKMPGSDETEDVARSKLEFTINKSEEEWLRFCSAVQRRNKEIELLVRSKEGDLAQSVLDGLSKFDGFLSKAEHIAEAAASWSPIVAGILETLAKLERLTK